MRLLAIVFLVVGTCAFAPSNTTSFDPPEHYREVFKQAVDCTGKYKPYSRINWYSVPGKDWKCDKHGMRCIGQFQSPNRILIASEWRTTDWVIKHEMIHYVTGYSHDAGPRDLQVWGKQCHAMWGWLPTDSTYKP
jgi:hypothetical protein